jgi:hypothetical protein
VTIVVVVHHIIGSCTNEISEYWAKQYSLDFLTSTLLSSFQQL